MGIVPDQDALLESRLEAEGEAASLFRQTSAEVVILNPVAKSQRIIRRSASMPIEALLIEDRQTVEQMMLVNALKADITGAQRAAGCCQLKLSRSLAEAKRVLERAIFAILYEGRLTRSGSNRRARRRLDGSPPGHLPKHSTKKFWTLPPITIAARERHHHQPTRALGTADAASPDRGQSSFLNSDRIW